MKITRYFLPFLLLLAIGCSSGSGFKVSGKLKGFEGKTLFLQKFENNKPLTIDSVKIADDGDFQFTAKIPYIDYYRLMVDDNNAFVFVADTAGELKIEVNGLLARPEKIEGQEDTKLMYEFNVQMEKLLARRDSLVNLAKMGMPVENEMNKFTGEALNFIRGFIDKHTNSPAALAALNNLNPAEELPSFVKVCDALGKRMPQSMYYQSLKAQVAQVAKENEMEQQMEQQRDLMLAVGRPAPNITMPDPTGKVRSLSELRGKVVLIDFWASWCGPCRQENPNVVATYKQFKNKGFEVFSVSLDKGKDAWVNAIREDGLTWTHVSDLKFWSSQAVADYGITAIPFTVLIDKEGNILAKNLRGEELAKKLNEVLH